MTANPLSGTILGGVRTRHWAFGIALPTQATALALIQGWGHAVCGTGLFDNPITYTTALTAIIGLIDFAKHSGKN